MNPSSMKGRGLGNKRSLSGECHGCYRTVLLCRVRKTTPTANQKYADDGVLLHDCRKSTFPFSFLFSFLKTNGWDDARMMEK